MDIFRELTENGYLPLKHLLFSLTRENAEIAHDLFVTFSNILYKVHLDKTILYHSDSEIKLPFEISIAAGLNKNAKIPPQIISALGFDRNVLGTFTRFPWKGKNKPRVKRYPDYNSLINWVAWENDGAEIISERQKSYKYKLPTTASIGPTPHSLTTLEERLDDIDKCINLTKDIPSLDRYEYCPSCANLDICREDNQKTAGTFTEFIRKKINPWQRLDIKVSPDMNPEEIDKFIESTFDFVDAYVLTNTTTHHDYGRGTGSGEILYPFSLKMQKEFYKRLKKTRKKIVACGGINSIEKMEERRKYGATEFQFLTSVISNFKLIREIRKHNWD